MQFFLLLSLVAFIAADSCVNIINRRIQQLSGYAAVPLLNYEDEAEVLTCLRSAMNLTRTEATKTLNGVKQLAELYAFTEDLKNPPAAVQESGVDSSIDILGRLAAIDTNSDAFDFYMELSDIFARARDAQTGFSVPCYNGAFYFYIPLMICPAVEGGELFVRTCGKQPMILTTLGTKVPLNERIVDINGVDALQFVQEFADTHSLTGRDKSQRFELFIARQQWLNVRDMLHTAGGQVQTDALAFRQLSFLFDDGTTADIPVLFMINTNYKAICAGTAKPPAPFSPARVPQPLALAVGADPDFSLNIIDDQCFLTVGFAPANSSEWARDLAALLTEASEHQCGIPIQEEGGKIQGRRLIIDLRKNAGGQVFLIDTFMSSLFPNLTPHHSTIITKRLSKASSSLVQRLAKVEGPYQYYVIREPYTFARHKVCRSYSPNCAGWRRRPMSHGGQDYSLPMHMGPLPWEAPNYTKESRYVDWIREKRVSGRYGDDSIFIGIIRQIQLRLNGYEPAPELTIFLTGATTAGGGADVAARALSYGAGAVVRIGYAGHNPKMAALAQGGNNQTISNIAGIPGQQIMEVLPYGADLSVTTMASLPLTHSTTPSDKAISLEFVPLPPTAVLEYWDSDAPGDASQDTIASELKRQFPQERCFNGFYSSKSGLDCDIARFPHAKRVGRLCDVDKGTYTGPCGVALCEFGFELQNGECVDNGLIIPSKIASITMGASIGILCGLIGIGLVAIVIIVVCCMGRK